MPRVEVLPVLNKVLSQRGLGVTLIAQIFSVTNNAIARIVSGQSWKYHVQG